MLVYVKSVLILARFRYVQSLSNIQFTFIRFSYNFPSVKSEEYVIYVARKEQYSIALQYLSFPFLNQGHRNLWFSFWLIVKKEIFFRTNDPFL